MRNIIIKYLVFGTIVFFSIVSCTTSNNQNKKCNSPVKIILDTDIAGNHDDVGAIAMLHSFSNSGEADILAMAISERGESAKWGARCVDAINTYFNRPNIPIGVPTHGYELNKIVYSRKIAEEFPYELDTIWDATELYRKVLSEQADTSVVIATIGFMTNIANLLKSEPDEYSNLNGVELVNKKVKRWVCMSGYMLRGGSGTNITSDAPTTKYAFDNFPRPILFLGNGMGWKTLTGKRLPYMEKSNPIKRATEIVTCAGCGSASSDQLSILAAVRGVDRYFGLETKGYCSMSADPEIGIKWKDSPNKDHSYVTVKVPLVQLQDTIEDLMMDLANSNRQAFFTMQLNNTIEIGKGQKFAYKLPYYNYNRGNITIQYNNLPNWISFDNDSIFGIVPDTVADMNNLFTATLINNNTVSDSINISVSVLKTEPLVSNIEFANGYNYIAIENLKENDKFYADRNRTLKYIPTKYNDCIWFVSPLRSTTGRYYLGEKFVSFKVSSDVNVYVGYDEWFLELLPEWLKDWEDTGDEISDNKDRKFRVFKKAFKKGNVVLGNLTTKEDPYRLMYLILVEENI